MWGKECRVWGARDRSQKVVAPHADCYMSLLASNTSRPADSLLERSRVVLSLKRHIPPRSTNLPGQWLQCQADGSNVYRVLRLSAPSCSRGRPWLESALRTGYDPSPDNRLRAITDQQVTSRRCPSRQRTRLQGHLAHKKPRPLGPYSSTMPRALLWSYGGRWFLMSGVPL